MSEHTPGPWQVRGPSKVPGRKDMTGDFAIVSNGKIIAEAFFQIAKEYYAPAEANARLIAAAPDLLKILKRLLASCEYNDPETEAMRLATEIIAKVEGREPVSLQEEIDRS